MKFTQLVVFIGTFKKHKTKSKKLQNSSFGELCSLVAQFRSMAWFRHTLYIFNTILPIALNVIALQETHLTHDQEYLFQCALLNYCILFENGISNSAGVLIAVKQNCGIEIKSYSGKAG